MHILRKLPHGKLHHPRVQISTKPLGRVTPLPSDVRRTTNWAVSFHSHFNVHFIFVILPYMAYLDVIMEIQTGNYIKIRHISETLVQLRTEREKIEYITELWTKLQSGDIYIRISTLKVLAIITKQKLISEQDC